MSRMRVYRYRKEHGLCVQCGHRLPPNYGFARCDLCRLSDRERYRKNPTRFREEHRERYHRHEQNRCCPRCGKALPLDYNHKFCSSCLAYFRQYLGARPKKKRPYKKRKQLPQQAVQAQPAQTEPQTQAETAAQNNRITSP